MARLTTWILLLCCVALGARGEEAGSSALELYPSDHIGLPKSVPDPIEPFNRAVWAFNKSVMSTVIQPTSWLYRRAVPKPFRRGVGNFGRNLTFPVRLLNNVLQGKWQGAGDESRRFAANTIAGFGGFIDAASIWEIPKSDADFGETLARWGWNPSCFLMLPIFGPSNERDALGLAVDTASNPLVYISPYELVMENPMTYLGPYSYFNYAALYNELADSVGEYVRFSKSESDPYATIQYAWTFARKNKVADYEVNGLQDDASLETLQSVFFSCENPEFPSRGRTKSVLIQKTGKHLKFTCWLQPGPAPIVYIIPGLGSHRLAQSALALAELVFKRGFSAVTVSSAFNPEFMEHASTAQLPAYLPADGEEVHAALTAVDRKLDAFLPGRLGKRALMGYSMGALHTLFVAATETTNESSLIKFDRFVAINTPVRLLHGASMLDEQYNAPLSWPVEERMDNIENTFLKVAELSHRNLAPQTSLPFSATESQFLIGLTFRLILRDVLYSSQRRANQGILQRPLSNWRRTRSYEEIMRYSYKDYFEKFALPYYRSQGIAPNSDDALEKAGDLRTYESSLRSNPRVRVFTNRNDFLLTASDIEWLESTFPSDRLKMFDRGGHLGNLSNPNVQKALLQALDGLRSESPDKLD